MKMEYGGGTGNKIGNVGLFEPGQISSHILKKVEEFRFPKEDFLSIEERNKEIEFDSLYHDRSVYVLYLSHNNDTILACAKIIYKTNSYEKLPIEFGKTVSITDSSPLIPVNREIGTFFSIKDDAEFLPVCEIGGLRVAGVNPDRGITLRMRYNALDTVMKTCHIEIHKRGFKHFFLTCIGTPHMERLYHNRYSFNEVAKIRYADHLIWKALWKLPFSP
jgi:hypothetical protein